MLSVTSFDGGRSWPQTRQIATSNRQITCLPTAASAQIARGIRSFGFANDRTGDYWVAVTGDDMAGIDLYFSRDLGDTWNFATTVVAPGGGQHFFPALAGAPPTTVNGRVGLTFQTLNPASNQIRTWFAGHSHGSAAAALWSTPLALTTSFASLGARNLGDYNDVVGISLPRPGGGSDFLAAWTDTTASSPMGGVHAVTIHVRP